MVEKALEPTRLHAILQEIETQRMTAKENSGELLRLEAEMASAKERISRLMTMVEHGLADVSDPDLAARLTNAKRDRDIAAAGIERARRRVGSAIELESERIVAFSNYMKDRVRNGEVPFRKAYIRSLLERVVVNDDTATLSGRRDRLQALATSKFGKGSEVPTGIQEWRAGQNKSANTYVIEITR